jgi:hypothetical protein
LFSSVQTTTDQSTAAMRHHNSVVVSRVLMVGNPDIPDGLAFGRLLEGWVTCP